MALDREKMIWMYRKMLEIRHFEMKAMELYGQNLIRGVIHPYVGEEAIAVGACAALDSHSYITSTHRGHGHCIAKGGKLPIMMAELLGKATGYCKGKGGSMHIADFDSGILGANGIVGGGIPIAVGAGVSTQLLGTDYVTVCFFSDGATNTGAFHEAINLAAIWKLPVVFICENNQYGLSTPVSYAVPLKDIADRAAAYGIPGVAVDGNDVLAVYEATEAAIVRAREGKGPTLIEAKTYRRTGHFLGDPCVYRSEEEVKTWEAKDPIERYKIELLNRKVLTEAEANSIRQEVAKTIEEAAQFAIQSPDPAPESALQDIYV